MKLIVGLGNPGREYLNTRHNVGFMALDRLAKVYNFSFHDVGIYRRASSIINGEKVYFIKPLTYMNNSGEAVKAVADYFKIDVSDILIIHDDLDLPVGTYKIKQKGSSGGHNGLKSIEEKLGTQEYKRIKIGISKNKNIETVDYVLGKFTPIEREALNKALDDVIKIVNDYFKLSFDQLMSKYNGNN